MSGEPGKKSVQNFIKRTLLVQFLVLSVMVANTYHAYACQHPCKKWTIAEDIELSAAVFQGWVESVDKDGYTFVITKVWKGEIKRNDRIQVAWESGKKRPCPSRTPLLSPNSEKQYRYVVFARQDRNEFQVPQCTNAGGGKWLVRQVNKLTKLRR